MIHYSVKFFSIFTLIVFLIGATIPLKTNAQLEQDPWDILICDMFFTDNFLINFVNMLTYAENFKLCYGLYIQSTTIPESGTINRPVSSQHEPGNVGVEIGQLQEGVSIGISYLLAQRPEAAQTKRAQDVFGKIKKLNELPSSQQELKDHVYGPATQESVRMLQVLMGLPLKYQTGVMGPITADRLQKIFIEVKQQRIKKQSSSSSGSSFAVSAENELAVRVEMAQIIQSLERILSLIKK